MRKNQLEISRETRRRFILGKQGLYPGRRWRGKEGALQAIRAGCPVQLDPLNVVAHSQDIVLYGRVLDYQPAHLDALIYGERACFDYGGTLMVYPMEELPYWRVAMQRRQQDRRWVDFKAGSAHIVEQVRAAIRERGPLGTRDFAGEKPLKGYYRSGKDSGLALYYLWLTGELMIHSRRRLEKLYDLRERVAPPALDYAASVEEAEDYFALKAFRVGNLLTLRDWRNGFMGAIRRTVEPGEAQARLESLLASGVIAQVGVEDDGPGPSFLLAEDLPLLETLHASGLPAEWRPLEGEPGEEMVALAPLEIVSARGRARTLFGFEYLWEVYKPLEQRRWGYYTLPILYSDRLVARFDSKLERSSGTLGILGFWLEEGALVDEAFAAALRAGLRRFMRFTGAERLALAEAVPAEVRAALDGI